MNITNLTIDTKCLGSHMYLVDVTPCYAYINGIKGDTIEGYRYTVALPEMGFEKIGVKVMGEKLIDKPESYIEVTFEGLELFIYWRAGSYDVGATATNLKPKTKA